MESLNQIKEISLNSKITDVDILITEFFGQDSVEVMFTLINLKD